MKDDIYDTLKSRIVQKSSMSVSSLGGTIEWSIRLSRRNTHSASLSMIEVCVKGSNIRFVVTKNRNNSPETIYRCCWRRGEMDL